MILNFKGKRNESGWAHDEAIVVRMGQAILQIVDHGCIICTDRPRYNQLEIFY